MGSLNPVFLPDALKIMGARLQKVLFRLSHWVWGTCTNPSVLLALDCPALDTFLRETSQHVQACEPETMLHKGIHLNYTELSEAFSNLSGVSVVAKTKSADAKKLEADVTLLETNFSTWSSTQKLQQECFGPTSIIIRAKNAEELLEFARNMEGSLTATLHGTNEDLDTHKELVKLLETRVGRLVFNGFPPGVEIGYATHHGGPYPATSTGAHTSIGLGFYTTVCSTNLLSRLPRFTTAPRTTRRKSTWNPSHCRRKTQSEPNIIERQFEALRTHTLHYYESVVCSIVAMPCIQSTTRSLRMFLLFLLVHQPAAFSVEPKPLEIRNGTIIPKLLWKDNTKDNLLVIQITDSHVFLRDDARCWRSAMST